MHQTPVHSYVKLPNKFLRNQNREAKCKKTILQDKG